MKLNRKVIRIHLIKGGYILIKIRQNKNKAVLNKCLSKLFHEKNTFLNKTECCSLAFKTLKRSTLAHMHELSLGSASPLPAPHPFSSRCTPTLVLQHLLEDRLPTVLRSLKMIISSQLNATRSKA